MMKNFQRTITGYLKQHPNNLSKMIFITGPRQVGKTTLVKSLPQHLGRSDSLYLSWDITNDRKILRKGSLDYFKKFILNSKQTPLILLDEIHKNPRWKKYLKGFYDALSGQTGIAVTGSARLDVYRKGGDSLLGRYWLFHLLPLTIAELLNQASLTLPSRWPTETNKEIQDVYQKLFDRGGFPEPYFSLSETDRHRWTNLRREILLKEDLRDLSRIAEITHIETLMELLPSKVGSPLSVNSLREDIEVAFNTVKNWLAWLERLYYIFFVPVYSKHIARSLKKDRKVYLYHWAELDNLSARFENLVAVHLLKAVQGYNDMQGEELGLYYLRDKEKHEVDFLVTRSAKPWLLLETKTQPDQDPSPLIRFSEFIKPDHTIILTHEPCAPSWKVWNGVRYWESPASVFFSNWL